MKQYRKFFIPVFALPPLIFAPLTGSVPTVLYMHGHYFRIVQQAHVLDIPRTTGTVSQFAMAQRYGVIGLLAHVELDGEHFLDLKVGEEIKIIYGNPNIPQIDIPFFYEVYTVTEIQKYKALQPNSPYSDFEDLQTGEVLTAEQLFKRVYMGKRHVTLQTCIRMDGDPTAGRIFIIAYPKRITAKEIQKEITEKPARYGEKGK